MIRAGGIGRSFGSLSGPGLRGVVGHFVRAIRGCFLGRAGPGRFARRPAPPGFRSSSYAASVKMLGLAEMSVSL